LIVAQEKPQYQSPPGKRRHPVPTARRAPLTCRGRLTLTGLVVLAFLTGIMVCYLHVQIMTTGEQMVTVEKKLDDLDVQTRELSGQVAALSSLKRVEQVATTRLGMVRPDNSQVVLVRTTPVKTVAAARPSSGGQKKETARNRPPENGRSWILQALVELVDRSTGKVHPG